MISLFIDTSLSDVSIALLNDRKMLSCIQGDIPGEHSVYVTKYIEDILKEQKLSPKEINEIIVVNGPVSFTGIRIGVTIAKTFAYLTNIRIVTITSLQARIIGRKAEYFLSTIDAKHDNYYVGLYDNNYEKVSEEFLTKNMVNELIKKYNPLVITEKDKYNIEEIVEYTRKFKSENVHSVNPVYLKSPQVN